MGCEMNKLDKNYKNNLRGSMLGAFVICSGGYLGAFLRDLGGSDTQFAMLNALPAMVAVLSLIPGAMIIDKAKNKLKTTLTICFLSRVFFLLFALIPFLPENVRPLALVMLIGLRNAPESVWNIGYQSLMADVFPMDKLNYIMGKRSKYNNIIALGSTFLVGMYLNLYDKLPVSNMFLFITLFIFTFVIGMIEIRQYSKFAMIEKECFDEIEKISYIDKLKSTIKSIPSLPDYKKYCMTIMLFYIGWQMGWPLFNIYMLKVLKATPIWISYCNIASTASQILTITFWVKQSEKIGTKPVLGICMMFMALSPICYAVSTSMPMLVVMSIIIGSGMSGGIYMLFNELIYVSPEKNRTLYISLFTVLTQITSSFMPFVGTYIASTFSIRIALYVSAALRAAGAIVFLLAFRTKKNKPST